MTSFIGALEVIIDSIIFCIIYLSLRSTSILYQLLENLHKDPKT